MKAKGYVVQFFTQKMTALVHTRVQLRSSNSFFRIPILMAADKPCPQLQPSLVTAGVTAEELVFFWSNNWVIWAQKAQNQFFKFSFLRPFSKH